MEKTLLLLSGGVDSAVLMASLSRDREVSPLFIHYGQRAAKWERQAAEEQTAARGLELISLDIASVADIFSQAVRLTLLKRQSIPIVGHERDDLHAIFALAYAESADRGLHSPTAHKVVGKHEATSA